MSQEREESHIVETIEFFGHSNVLATHYNTIEITKVAEISKRADCIIGVRSSKACADLSLHMKNHIRAGGRLRFEIKVGKFNFTFSGRGRKELTLSDTLEIVLRRSDFVSDRTGAIACDAAAIDLPRPLVKLLQYGSTQGTLTISAIAPIESSEAELPLLVDF